MNLKSALAVALLSANVNILLAASPPAPASISPEAREYLNTRKAGNVAESPMEDAQGLARLRAALDRVFLLQAQQIDPDVFVREQIMNGVQVFWVNGEAPEEPGPVIIYLHGGGHIIGSARTSLASAIRVRRASGLPVLSIEYRLAPEHPFPADVDDVSRVYKWLLDAGYTANQIGVYGESAGGALAVAMVLEARANEWPLPAAVAALSPMADVGHSGDSRITLADVDPVIRQPFALRYQAYVGDADAKNPLLSPVYANYTGFPPLLIQVGTRERLLSDSVRMARKARADGATVQFDVWDGMWHVWQGTPGIPEAEQACEELAAFIVNNIAM